MRRPIKEISMSTASASRADDSSPRPLRQRLLVWDAPVRVFHWLMVLSFAGAYLTAESERWRLVHVTLGYTMAGLVAFRLVWGLVGTRHARFVDFVRGPTAVAAYVRSLLVRKPDAHAGHNPAGALAIVALLTLAAGVAASGWMTYAEIGGKALEELHEGIANAMLAVVGVHVAAVLLGSWWHRENLVASMITGRKLATPDEGIRHAWRSVAVLMLAAVLGFWWLQWRDAPAKAAGSAGHPVSSVSSAAVDDHDKDD
jgi:cytochrome b